MACDQELVDELSAAYMQHPYSLLFPNLDTPAGQELLDGIICYMLVCYDYIRVKCPKLWDCFYPSFIANSLYLFPASISEIGQTTINPDDIAGKVYFFLKRRTIGQKTCEWESYEPECKDCSQTQTALWKHNIDDAIAKCDNAIKPLFLGGGSFYNFCEKKGSCYSND